MAWIPSSRRPDAGWRSRRNSGIGNQGATNAALFAVAILANSRLELARKAAAVFREDQEKQVRDAVLE